MKKVMFLLVGMLFAASVNAATITLSDKGGLNSTFIGAFPNGGNLATASLGTNGPTFAHSINMNTDMDGMYRIEWGFDPAVQLVAASLSGVIVAGSVVDNFVTTIFLAAGDHIFNIAGETAANGLTYNLSVSAVPVPAALFLFAPALLGFFGLRRKAAVAA